MASKRPTSPLADLFRDLTSASAVSMSRRDALRASVMVATGAAIAAPVRSPLPVLARQDVGSEPGTLTLPFNSFGQDVVLDPHIAPNWGPFWVMLPYVWAGLLRFDENGAVELDLAESFEPNDDGSVWTAVLREGAMFATGEAILAEHVRTSWARALDATRVSPMSRYLAPIAGFQEASAGNPDALGVEVIDDRTIEITLSEPLAYFPSWVATFAYAIVHPALAEFDASTPEATDVSLNNAGAGAWTISEFVADESITMVPNPNYWEEASTTVTSLVWKFAPSGDTDQTILDWYANDEVAIADVPTSMTNDLPGDAQLVRIDPQSSTLAIALDFRQAPFNDVRVRRAVASAIDRTAWASDIQGGEYVQADAFSPPVLTTLANYEPPTGVAFDAAGSVTLLQEAGIDPENPDSEIIYFQSATDSTHRMEASAALLEMIETNSGLAITHDTNLTSEQITALREDNGGLQFDIVQWQLDSDMPSMIEIASQESQYNHGWFNWDPTIEAEGEATPGEDAAKFDELVSEARVTLDESERNRLYAEAETLLLENAVLIPLGYWSPAYVQKPSLTGTRQGPFSGSTPVRINAEVSLG